MTDLDKAGMPAKDYEYRAFNPRNRDAIMLEDPSYVKYHPGYKLQKRDNNGHWADATAPEADARPEDEGNSPG